MGLRVMTIFGIGRRCSSQDRQQVGKFCVFGQRVVSNRVWISSKIVSKK